ncbi:SDR family NAD(P)-dependent oxidoreductase [Plantactinospora sp. GCM10030261]|uniref:SDR family NAD(P)-dependent oxidoreductase n=1 Tax=Plantactinospora sp. GCM10030261 TaxID=3273420 RepID=UPI00361A4844
MNLGLDGRRALVTGSSSGIGARIAEMLADEGVTVVVHGRSVPAMESVVQNIRARGGDAEPVAADLLDPDGPRRLAVAAERYLGGVDILVNCAATGLDRPWDGTTEEDWRRLHELNVVTPARLAQALVPGMRRRGWGRLIQIASGAATQPQAASVAYSTTKAGLVNLTTGLAQALDRSGITVNTVSPGVILTPRVEAYVRGLAAEQGWGDDWSDIEQRVLAGSIDNPTGRLGTPDDVAALVVFLASPLAGFINGTNHRVDGGAIAVVN